MMACWRYLFVLFCSMFFGLNLYGQNDQEYNSENIFIDPDEMPRLPDSIGFYQDYIKNNIRFPIASNCQEGTVFLQATIDTNGIVKDIILRKGICPLFDEEAIRLISNMPKWIPAKQNGKIVNIKITFPNKFIPGFYK